MLTKGEAREIVRELVDDPSGERWGDRVLDVYIGTVLDDLWSQLLTMAPYSNWAVATPPVVDGVADLDELPERFFRILQVKSDGRVLHPVTAKSADLDSRSTYSLRGLSLMAAVEEVEVAYSYLPQRYSDLEQDAMVEWPDGMETAYLHEVAGRMLTKGGAEDPSVHLQIASRSLQQTMALVQRRYPAPITIEATTSAVHFGGI